MIPPKELEAAREIIRRAGKSVLSITPGYLSRGLKCEPDRAEEIIEALRKETQKKPSEELDPVVEHRLKMENKALRAHLSECLSREVLDQRYQTFVAEVAQYRSSIRDWQLTPKAGRTKQAMPVAHLSDTHFDERVDGPQVGWLNVYNREIAELRLRRFFEKTITLCDDYLKGVHYPGIVLCVSGDMFSGNIHEELRETNEAGICASFRYWIDPMGAGIKMLAERFGKVAVHWVVGNHPRLDKKPRAKGGVTENFDHLLGSMLQRDFGRDGDKRVSFHISDSFDHYFRVFRTRYCQTHGDQFRGGSGIAAELSPLMIGDSRKREKAQAAKTPYDILIMGHFHRRLCLPSIKANGALKGWDEYAAKMNFRYQEPMQSLWLDTPENGITVECPIFVMGKESWQRERDRAAA
jgi:hypothetical protein